MKLALLLIYEGQIRLRQNKWLTRSLPFSIKHKHLELMSYEKEKCQCSENRSWIHNFQVWYNKFSRKHQKWNHHQDLINSKSQNKATKCVLKISTRILLYQRWVSSLQVRITKNAPNHQSHQRIQNCLQEIQRFLKLEMESVRAKRSVAKMRVNSLCSHI